MLNHLTAADLQYDRQNSKVYLTVSQQSSSRVRKLSHICHVEKDAPDAPGERFEPAIHKQDEQLEATYAIPLRSRRPTLSVGATARASRSSSHSRTPSSTLSITPARKSATVHCCGFRPGVC